MVVGRFFFFFAGDSREIPPCSIANQVNYTTTLALLVPQFLPCIAEDSVSWIVYSHYMEK